MTHMTYEEALARDGECINHVRGYSMAPLFLDMESVVRIVPAGSRMIVPGDVVLYKGIQPDSYILHRVMYRIGDAFLVRGDNNDAVETVPSSAVVGIMAGYCRKRHNVYRTTNSPLYKGYVILLPLLRSRPVRLAVRFIRKGRRILHSDA